MAVGGDDVAADPGVGESAGRRLGQAFAAHVSGGGEAGLGVDVEAAAFVEAGPRVDDHSIALAAAMQMTRMATTWMPQ